MLRDARIALTLGGYDSIASFAREVGEHRSELSMAFSGRLALTPPKRRKVAAALGVHEAELFAPDGRVWGAPVCEEAVTTA